MIPKVEGQLSKKYPDDPDKLVHYLQLVLGPVVAEIRRRFNGLGPKLASQIEADAAAISALDTTGMAKYTTMIDSELGDVYWLDPTGVPGGGDLAATPTGAWVFSYTL